MASNLLVCTDLDRTLIPNGPQAESPKARQYFAALARSPNITLAYVSGRDKTLVEKAINDYSLPTPDHVIGDVGTTIYHVSDQSGWHTDPNWETRIGQDWHFLKPQDLAQSLTGIHALTQQEPHKQNRYKLSYYVQTTGEQDSIAKEIRERLEHLDISFNLIWSFDETTNTGLLDILPKSASKRHAIEALMTQCGATLENTVFSGDSGNDIEVLTSPIASILVANSQPDVRDASVDLANKAGVREQLYLCNGGFLEMNGNYAAGILEGIHYYHPDTINELISEDRKGIHELQ